MTQVPLPPPPQTGQPIDGWLHLLWRRLTQAGQVFWSSLNFTGSNLADLVTRNHGDLQNINTATYTHVTAAEYAALVYSSDSRLSDARNALAHTHSGADVTSAVANATTAASCSGNSATATTASACSGNSATATTASACSGNSATATDAARVAATNWVIEEVAGKLYFKYGGVSKASLDSTGNLIVTGNVTAFGTP